MTYNEYWQVIDAGIKPEISSPSNMRTRLSRRWKTGFTWLEDKLKDPGLQGEDVKFVRASMKAGNMPRSIRMKPPASCSKTTRPRPDREAPEAHDERSGQAHRRLHRALDEADYKRTVESLLKGGSDPVITKEPAGAFTHEITEAALK